MKKMQSNKEQLDVIGKNDDAWFKIWIAAYVPKPMHLHKWFKTDCDLVLGTWCTSLRRTSQCGRGRQVDHGNGEEGQ